MLLSCKKGNQKPTDKVKNEHHMGLKSWIGVMFLPTKRCQ